MLGYLSPLFIIILAAAAAAQVSVSSPSPADNAGTARRTPTEDTFKQLLYMPAPTPRKAESGEEASIKNKRPSGFYDEDKAPADDAPEEDLVDYWERWANTSGGERRKPSDAVRERLLAASEAEPTRLSRLLPVLPDTLNAAERVKKLYTAAQGDSRFDEEWVKSVRKWLLFNSQYFVNELLAMAQKAKDKEGYVDNEEALKALAKVDWKSAEPLLQSMAGGGQVRTAAVALSLLYRHAIEEEDAGEEDEEEEESVVRAKRRRLEFEREKERIKWRAFTGTKLGAVTSQPEGYTALDVAALDIDDDDFPSHLNAHLAQATAGAYVILAADMSKGGLWKKASGRKAQSISSEGVYANPLVTADGIWVVAAKADTDWGRPNDVIRFNLKTGREDRVNLPPAEQFEPLAYLAIHGKVLLRRARDGDDDRDTAGPASPEFYLLEAATGQTQMVKGIFEPLLQEGNRFLQSTGRADEFWAAIPDRRKNRTQVGRYNLRDFSFETALVIPHITFDSMSMWVDEERMRLYVVYEGQLLRLPLQISPQIKDTERE